MITLNLNDLERSQIKYKINRFPDGQQDIVLENRVNTDKFGGGEVDLTTLANSGINKTGVQIISRFNSFRDLELILCATAALRRLHVQEIDLYTPYMLGARSDIDFTKGKGGTSYEVDIVAPIINAQNYRSVTVMDPHSTVMHACIKNLTPISNVEFVEQVFRDNDWTDEFVIVSPDAGALKKIYDVASHLVSNGYDATEIAIGNKHRDISTGKILSTGISDINKYILNGYKFIIIDDICDGGRTFTELAGAISHEALKLGHSIPMGQIPEPEVYLIVTHGIFSAGMEALSGSLAGVFSTNSYSDRPNDSPYLKQTKII